MSNKLTEIISVTDKVSSIKSLENKIINGDVVKSLKMIPNDSVSLVFTSPPYNTEINYGNHEDNMPWPDYLNWLKEIWFECYRVLRPGGRLAINIDATTNWDDDGDKEYIRPIYAELVNMMREIDEFNFRTDIMWCKAKDNPEDGQVVGRATAWGSYLSCSNPIVMRNHEYILVWSKGSWKLEGDAELSDMTDKEFLKYTRSTWCVQPETKLQKNKQHPAPFPIELAKRVIKLFCYRGDLILDPFNGSGSSTAAAAELNRRYIGIDIDPEYCKLAKSRTETRLQRRLADEEMNPYEPRSFRIANSSYKKKSKTPQVELFDE